MSGWLRLAPLLSLVLLGADAEADAIPIPLIEVPCGAPPEELRCYGMQADLTTTVDQLDVDWVVTPILPPDPENWRLIGLSAGFGSSTYVLVYPDASPDLEFVQVTASFIDATGRSFLEAGNVLQPFCSEVTSGEHIGKWLCSDGNSLGAPYIFDPQDPLDPLPPSLDGPITIRVAWTVVGADVPEFASLNVNAVSFGYELERLLVPEPSSGVLLLAGLTALARWRSQRGRAINPAWVGGEPIASRRLASSDCSRS